MMEERRVAKESEAAEERAFWAEQREREAEMERIVEEERLKLLKSHASRLVGHLPSGIIREEDLDHLDDEVRKSFRKTPAYRDPIEFLEEHYRKK